MGQFEKLSRILFRVILFGSVLIAPARAYAGCYYDCDYEQPNHRGWHSSIVYADGGSAFHPRGEYYPSGFGYRTAPYPRASVVYYPVTRAIPVRAYRYVTTWEPEYVVYRSVRARSYFNHRARFRHGSFFN